MNKAPGESPASTLPTNTLASVPMVWGYAMLVLSVVLNGWRYNLESAALKVRPESGAPISVWAVSALAPLSGAAAFLLAAWIWRRMRWSWGSLDRVSLASCIETASKQGIPVLLAAICGSSGQWFLNQSNKLYGPEFTAFLGNLMPVLLVMSGLLSGERLQRREIAAIATAIAGAFLFSYRHGQMNWAGIGLMTLGSVLMAAKKTVMKRATGIGHLPSVMMLSLVLMGAWSLVGGATTGTLHFGTLKAVGFCMAGGVAGAMIGMSLLYAGLNVVGLARGAPIDTLRPLSVLAIGIVGGTALPARLQLVGGAMVLLGSFALAKFATARGRLRKAAPPADGARP
jgi:drug/metabolite transporter (DMT)-like permease